MRLKGYCALQGSPVPLHYKGKRCLTPHAVSTLPLPPLCPTGRLSGCHCSARRRNASLTSRREARCVTPSRS